MTNSINGCNGHRNCSGGVFFCPAKCRMPSDSIPRSENTEPATKTQVTGSEIEAVRS